MESSGILDAETKVHETPGAHKDELRLWLRLLTCTTLIEGEVRRRLRERFDVTLPRFDLMAQLVLVRAGGLMDLGFRIKNAGRFQIQLPRYARP